MAALAFCRHFKHCAQRWLLVSFLGRERRVQPLFHFHAFLSYTRLRLNRLQTSHWGCDDGPGQRCPEIMAGAWPGEAAASRTEALTAAAAVSLTWAHVNTDRRHPACKLVIAVAVLCTCVQKQNLQRKTTAIYRNRSVRVVDEAISRAPTSLE